MNRKNTEYLVAGALALYVVFFTRPAPFMVTNVLASPVAQVAALAVVIYVGAKHSLLVAVVLALAVVMSMPSREHLASGPSDKEKDKKPAAPKKPAPAAPAAGAAPAASKKAEKADKKPDAAEPAPGGDSVGAQTEAKGSEKFSLMNAAPF